MKDEYDDEYLDALTRGLPVAPPWWLITVAIAFGVSVVEVLLHG